uniref:G_PROTEIN_RECEP_F1_2 domain-containing protein n=1 Tax=Trichobilharzia regenti TaxID=157069 RepID=A0AA85JP85_TRIRE|nr:unnamed protein product [Trichobilharzia regenti]
MMNHFNMTELSSNNDLNNLYELRNLVRTICTQLLIPIVCIIGISTNVLNILVLARPKMNSSTNKYLLAVAVCDLFYGITLILLSLRPYKEFEKEKFYMYLLPHIMAFGNLCSNTACWLTCAFTVERYIAVSSPMLARKIGTKQNCKWIILTICLFAFIVTFPDFLTHTTEWREESSIGENNSIQDDLYNVDDLRMRNNITVNSKGSNTPMSTLTGRYNLVNTELGKILIRIGWPVILIILVVILPLIILTVFNGLLIKSIIQASKIRVKLTKKSSVFLLPKLRYDDTCRTDSLSNLTKDITVPLRNEGQNEYSIKNSLRNHQRHCKHRSQHIQQRHSQRIVISPTGIINDSIDKEDDYEMTGNENLPINIDEQQFNCTSTTIHKPRSYFNERERITLMLILIVVAFCVLTMPSALVHLIKVSRPNLKNEEVRLNLLIAGNFVNLCLAINSTLNFFFYSWLSRRFRRTFYNLRKCK